MNDHEPEVGIFNAVEQLGVSDVLDKRDGKGYVWRPKEKQFLYKGGGSNANPTSWFCGVWSVEK